MKNKKENTFEKWNIKLLVWEGLGKDNSLSLCVLTSCAKHHTKSSNLTSVSMNTWHDDQWTMHYFIIFSLIFFWIFFVGFWGVSCASYVSNIFLHKLVWDDKFLMFMAEFGCHMWIRWSYRVVLTRLEALRFLDAWLW